MSAITQAEIFEACRTIYRMAAEDFMLPPLIRDVESLSATSSRMYYSQARTGCVRFIVEFDEDYVNKNKFPLARFPLIFRCQFCSLTPSSLAIDLDEAERFALIRAFLLGAKAPIVAEKNTLPAHFKLLIKLSQTFFFEFGELVDEGVDLTSEEICRRVAQILYDKSKDFFGSAQEGLAVWSARAAQQLFREPKPLAEFFWPLGSQEAAAAPGS